jgi:hypothetical protein
MSLAIEFLDDNGLPSASIAVTERDGGYLLPLVRISAARAGVWVEDCAVVGVPGQDLTPAAMGADLAGIEQCRRDAVAVRAGNSPGDRLERARPGQAHLVSALSAGRAL